MTTVMFACRKNAGRSQMAAALMAHIAPHLRVMSGGTTPGREVHPQAREALAQIGLTPFSEQPQALTPDRVKEADWVITMGCGETCPVFPGKYYEDWPVEDPADQPIEKVALIRDDIERRVRDLLARIEREVPTGAVDN
ncbi:protein-tyrosine-phosphatase [Arcanobacterium wilhelmae]|uniref:Protein-tyrosine-phosphatase n=1 Tax=Arcanobacterium wilhelmae TaxID=1803177 RepID=A0ABT9NDT3_9ACTO|nr:heat-shock protein HtpX [Arcanobacterium wilhelmae]MDP9801678.1 protein-tyrosine-phosphatase [Arcanobacterium wilhelmae]WFN90999.1 heat-shock protein HtpX [Arcanobacterium wilhelmae]